MISFPVFVVLVLYLQGGSTEYECSPDDEFLDDNPTPEWTAFTDVLEKLTFQTYKLPCPGGQTWIYIDQNSDFLWSLRFNIYNHTFEKGQNTLDDCFKTVSDCGAPFRECMRKARKDMTDNLNNNQAWDTPINEQLKVMQGEEC